METTKFHPVHEINDGLMNTVSGKTINIFKPTAAMINIHDIAHGLSNICRFGGHVREFYSVAQHCVLVSRLASGELKREALLHDASEAYVGDMISPIKVVMPAYKKIENRFEIAIAEKFNLSHVKLVQVKPFDRMACEIEHDWLRMGHVPFGLESKLKIAWNPAVAYQLFMDTFNQLFND